MAYKKRICPREEFLKGTSIRFGATKYTALRSIMKNVILQIDVSRATAASVKALVKKEFDACGSVMLSFEKEQEQSRMEFVVCRWLDWEKAHQKPGSVISRDFANKVKIAGQERTQQVHWLVDRGGALEAIQFKYKQPEYSSRGRSAATKPSGSAELLMLQRAGEAEAIRLGIDIKKKPVFGAIYYLKSRSDSAKKFVQDFEESAEQNILTHYFTASDAQLVEDNYESTAPDVTKTCAEKSDCEDCQYYDLCYTEFEKRHKMERPEVALKTIDDITLTDAQLSFISFREGECRVNAVAGSGKTTIVTLRTLGLLEEGVDPAKILMVTFSEKAKEEMSTRLQRFAAGKMLEDLNLDVKKVQVETFNSWGQHVLDDNYALLGFTQKPSLVDDISKKDIIIRLLEKHRSLPLDYRNPFMSTRSAEGAVVKLGKWIDTMKAAHVETEAEVLATLGSSVVNFSAELLDIYQEYNQELLAINAIDYEDQLRLLLKLANHGVFEKMPYEHIVVDEFQDSNPNQIDLILSIMKQNAGVQSLAVVGDEMQAIYGFRNATPDNIINFDKYFKHVTDICLEDNFRSETPIIARANAILRKESAVNKQIKCWKKSPGLAPVVMTFSKPADEIDLYVRQVDKLLKDGVRASDIAILARTRNELIKIQEAFSEAKIPTILKVPEIVGDSPYVKAIIALAHFLRDPQDLLDLALYAKSVGTDPMDLKAVEQLGVDIVTAMSTMTEAEKILAFFDLTKTHTEDYIADSFMEELREHQFHTLYQLCEYCAKYRKYEIKESHSTSREETEAVTLITVHSAKGLEWDTVLLSIKKFYTDAEERRLLYVAITRAKHRLLVTADPQQVLLLDLLMKD